MLIARFDGGCVPNPKGHASCACLITANEGEEMHRESVYLGFGEGQTNNVSEFQGLLLILNWAIKNKVRETIHILSDSQIVVRRIRSKSLPNGVCRGVAVECLSALKLCAAPIYIEWEGRAANDECDAMCDLEIAEAVAEAQRL